MTQIADSVVLVTGSNRGLGAEFVRQALARGARKVYATARRPEQYDDSRIVTLALDVTREDDIRQAAVTAADATIVVNNAGILVVSPVLAIGAADVRRMFETNVDGPIWMSQAFAPVLARNGGGAFVNLHSVMSWSARGGVYSATKAAFWSFSNSLRLELLAQGTQVLGVHLGYADTDMVAGLDVDKVTPAEVVADTWDALEAGASEVLADELTRRTRATLGLPLADQYPELSAASR